MKNTGMSLLAGAVLVAYPGPHGEPASADFTVAVDGQPVVVYTARTLQGGPASFASFDFVGPPVKVRVTAMRRIDSAKILPMAAGIQPAVVGNTVSITLAKPANLTLELNGSFAKPLHLFANPPEVDRPQPADKNVIYFGPGVHEVTTLHVQSGQTVYLAGGAVLCAKIPADEKPVQEKNWRGNKVYMPLLVTSGAKNITVRGRGILDMSQLPWHARVALWFDQSSNILVEGITIVDAPGWGVAMRESKNVTIRNVKQICARENSDGIDICNSQDVLVEDCFLRNNDDEVCVKTLLPPPAQESKNIVVQRCVIWNDRARGLGITSETRANISNVVFRNCDIIHDFSNGYDCSALAVLVSDAGTMRNIRFENICCEDVRNTLINCWIGADTWGHDQNRGQIQGVLFKDIRVTGPTFPVSKLTGFDEAHRVEDVTFERLQIQGKLIGNAAAANLQTNAHVHNVRFIGDDK